MSRIAAAVVVVLLAAGCGSATRSAGQGRSTGVAGTWVMNITHAEMEAMGRNLSYTPNWGFTRLVLHESRFRICDRRPPGELPLVQDSSSGCNTGSYSVRGDRLTFVIGDGYGDTPVGARGDPPIVVLWSIYRNTLTFRPTKKKDKEGPPQLFVKAWRRVS
jgi:hypothetical protein